METGVGYRFDGKVVYITGAASGFGEACARRFADAGALVVAADINLAGAERVAAALPGAVASLVDTSDLLSVRRSMAEAVAAHGRIDIVFNNAGITGDQERLHEMTLENWRKVTSVNGDGAFFVLKESIACFMKSGGGCIVNVASTVGLVAFDNLSHYTYAKAGLIGLTRSAAIEYAEHDIRVNAIAPTMVRTPLVEAFIDSAPDPVEMRAKSMRFNPKPGMPTVDDITGVVLFLASDDAAWITGHTIPIDGGYVAR